MPSGWLIAAGTFAAFIVLIIWLNIRSSARQRKAAGLRPQLALEEFVKELNDAGVTDQVAMVIHAELSVYCYGSVSLYSSDTLNDFLEIDLEERDFILAKMLKELRIPMPKIAVTQGWDPNTPLEIGQMLEVWQHAGPSVVIGSDR